MHRNEHATSARKPSRFGGRTLAAGLAVSLIFGLAACSDSGSTAEADSADFSQEAAAAVDRLGDLTEPVTDIALDLAALPAGGADLSGKKVVIIPLATAIFSTMIDTISEALDHTGAEVQVCDGKANPTEILSCMELAKSVPATAVITIAVSPDIAGNGYQILQDAGIHTLAAWQDPLGAEEGDLLRFYSSLPTIQRALSASTDYILSTSEEAPSILIIGNTDSEPIQQANEQWRDYTEEHCTTCQVSYKTSTTAQATQVKDLISSEMIANPDTSAALAFNLDTFGAPMVEGLANVSGDVRLGGQGVATVALQLLAEGRANHVVGTSYYFVGYAMTDALLRLVNGLDPVEYNVPIRVFTGDNVGELDLAPENVATFSWYGDPVFVEEFTAAWGL